MVGSQDNLDEGRSVNQNREGSSPIGNTGTGTLTGVDLRHPPRKIEDLGDTEKRFLAGAIRESYVQGLAECNRNSGGVSKDRAANYRLADQYIASSIPFLADVMGDVNTGGTSGR